MAFPMCDVHVFVSRSLSRFFRELVRLDRGSMVFASFRVVVVSVCSFSSYEWSTYTYSGRFDGCCGWDCGCCCFLSRVSKIQRLLVLLTKISDKRH